MTLKEKRRNKVIQRAPEMTFSVKCRHFSMKRLKFPTVMTDPHHAATPRGYLNVHQGECIKYSSTLYSAQAPPPLVLTQDENLLVREGVPVNMGQGWTLNPGPPHKGV